ncbi:glycosyltransferase family 2 protein [[Clostridium] scindens]|uniref:glycosyltransferase family 2 protein n=1 Tax=Clostridium scindens (strain JCM 10418 / VPI 12708) TaxID=29347 RepID=UPI001D075781|nr:glycosyltransferase family 2 protein [[Clostridium] scindens]MCB6288422.1 glycosyltransferase family 2 protein [[Clostridium] scindens]MCB6422932.1 glycosyltransferase family 2 protein [[Clostridium] scindens]MCB7194729.1 glycosyltransferase family 2 protein [[Clostridium] scindens]MCB7287915.1 glycosyltransferase family 2 protein [[Clostridium] scindens]MCG4931005.1 glycosyltransferase family 2 protein [[Clostridium] scindens]
MNREENRFELIESRFHLNDIGVYVFKGIYSKNKMEENKLVLSVDEENIPLDMEIKEGAEVRRMYGWYPYPIDTEYSFSCRLPEKLELSKKLKIFEYTKSGKREVYSISVKKLLKSRKDMYYAIESVGGSKGKVEITGWFIDAGDVEICILGKDNRKIESSIKYGYRRDVIEAFPEADPEKVKGFKAKFKRVDDRTVKLCFNYGDNTIKEVLPVHPSKIRKFNKIISSYLKKGYVYYKRYGIKLTIDRSKEKLFDRSGVNYERWLKKHLPNDQILRKQSKRRFGKEPKISIVIPLYKTPENYLRELVDSIKAQTYSNWELCLSDGSGKNSPILKLLKDLESSDARIKVVYNNEQLQISENTNRAIESATGDYIGFADHDDLLTPNALYECVRALNKHPGIRAIYSDEDKVSMDGRKHFQPHFKPDFNKDLLNSTNYFCHLFVVEKAIVDKVGALNSEFDGAQDYDFVLRCSEETENIYHIPKILYHWRAHEDSTAENPESKMYAFEAGARAIKAHYDRIGWENTEVTQTECLGVYRTYYTLKEEPLVSIIIPNKDHIDDLKKCLKSIERCSYKNYEIIIVENNSTEKETFEYYDAINGEGDKIKVIYWENVFNYSAINNYGVEHAKGDYLLFLNNDTEILNETCIEELLGFCMREDVGAVGARLYFEDGTIQHAGVVVGLGGIAGHIFLNTPSDQVGYFARIITQQDYSAVTAACIMVDKKVFEKIEGFDTNLQVAFNDIDLCLRIRELGKLVVYNPYAELYHYESKSRGSDNTSDKIERFNRETAYFENRWHDILTSGDPYYNRNFAIDRFDCGLKG